MELEGWTEYRRLVLGQLEKLESSISRLDGKLESFRNSEIAELKVEVAMLKVKAGFWGAIGAAIPTIGAILWMTLKQ
jgi:hypothetical protein